MAVDNQTREYALRFALDRFDRAADYWEQNYFERMRDWDDYYMVRLPLDLQAMMTSDEQSDLVPPDIHFLTNQFRADIIIPFQRTGRVARLRGIGPRDVQNEPFAQTLLDWQIELSDYWTEFDKDIQNIALGGYAIGILEKKPVVTRRVKKGRIVEEPMFGGAEFPVYRHLDRYKVVIDPRAKQLKYPYCRFVCYQVYMTREEILHERARNPKDWDFDPEELQKVSGTLTKDEEAVQRAKGYAGHERDTGDRSEPIPVTFYYGNLHREGGENDSKQVVIRFSNSVLLGYSEPSTDVPLVDMFQMMTLHPDDSKIVGAGKVEAIEDLFLEYYLKRNQRIEAVNTNAWGVNFIQRESEIPKSHRLGNMTFVEVDDPVQMQTFQGGDTGLLFNESMTIRNEMRENYGSDYGLGVNPQQKESATGASILLEQQGKSTISAVRQLWYSGLKRHMQLRFAMLQKYAPDEVYVRLSEEDNKPFERITKDQIDGQFDFSLALGVDDFTPDTIRQARIERLSAFYRDDPDIDQFQLKKMHMQANGLRNAGLLVIRKDEREQLPRTESTVMLRTGLVIPINDTDDDLLHYEIHIQALAVGLELANKGQILAEHLKVLQEHANQHQERAAARYGTQAGERSVMPGGQGGNLKQRRPSEQESGERERIREARSDAQIRSQQIAGPFQ